MRISLFVLAAVAPMTLLAGCTTTDKQLGIAVQYNMLAQVADLNPVYAGLSIEGSNGERSVDAIKRYNKGAVKPLPMYLLTPYEARASVVRWDMTAAMASRAVFPWSLAVAMTERVAA